MTDTAEPAPPGEESTPFSESSIRVKLEEYRDAPLIGLEYLVEIQGSRHSDPVFKCLLCNKTFDEEGVIQDLTSPDHRYAYLVIILIWIFTFYNWKITIT